MIYRNGIVTGLLCLLAAGTTWWLVAPKGGPAAKPTLPPPAVVLKEEQINVITLTDDAVQRLALRTAPVERKAMPRLRIYGGEMTVPVGQTVQVSAPLSGTLKELPEGMPQVGRTVKKGQALFQLLPLLTPEGRANLVTAKIEADGQVKTAQVQLDAARIALERAKRVFDSEAGSRRMLDEAQAQFELTLKALEAAQARRELLDKVVGEVEKGTAGPLTIESPVDGLLRNISAQPGQNVPASGALFEVADMRRLWVRVPVYVGDWSSVDVASAVMVGNLKMRPQDPLRPGKPAMAPPSANAATGTVDLYYEVDNHDGQFSPGQRVGVRLPIQSASESLTVPWSAILYDIHGGTWLYEQIVQRTHTYVRRRVDVEYVVGETAVLAHGGTTGNRVVATAPAVGTPVVVAGAAELFGTETGFTK